MNKEFAEAKQFLAEAGGDAEGLFAKREEARVMRRKMAEVVIPELNGKTLSIPGYLIPLEFIGTKVTEFLLVPWVGACIHTPLPPPNQIVYVKAAEAFQSSSQFEPVWVNGEILTTASTRNLFLKDSSGDFDVGYCLNASLVERYTK